MRKAPLFYKNNKENVFCQLLRKQSDLIDSDFDDDRQPDMRYRPIYCYLCLKNYRFKHTCNDDNDIRRRKQQKLALWKPVMLSWSRSASRTKK